MGPTHELPQTDTTERKFLSQCRLYIGNLVECSEEELIEMFKPYGEVSENFLNKEKMFAFIRLVHQCSYDKTMQMIIIVFILFLRIIVLMLRKPRESWMDRHVKGEC